MYTIKLYSRGKLLETLRYADQAAQQNAALAVARDWHSRADAWWFDKEETGHERNL